jgi:hypothetical protein
MELKVHFLEVDERRWEFTGWLLADITHAEDRGNVRTEHKLVLHRSFAGKYILFSCLSTDPPGGADEAFFVVTLSSATDVFLTLRSFGEAAEKLCAEAGLTADYEKFIEHVRAVAKRVQQAKNGLEPRTFEDAQFVVICDLCGYSIDSSLGRCFYEGELTALDSVLLCERCAVELVSIFNRPASKLN